MRTTMTLPLSSRYQVVQDLVLKKTKYHRPGTLINVHFVVAHETGTHHLGSGNTKRIVYVPAKNEVANLNRSNNSTYQSAHIFVDYQEIIECIPFLTKPNNEVERAVHVLNKPAIDNKMFGADANHAAGAVELCIDHRTHASRANNLQAYKRYVWVLAYACRKFNLDPRTHVVAHETLDAGGRRGRQTRRPGFGADKNRQGL